MHCFQERVEIGWQPLQQLELYCASASIAIHPAIIPLLQAPSATCFAVKCGGNEPLIPNEREWLGWSKMYIDRPYKAKGEIACNLSFLFLYCKQNPYLSILPLSNRICSLASYEKYYGVCSRVSIPGGSPFLSDKEGLGERWRG